MIRDQLGYVPVHWGFNTQDSNGFNESEILNNYYAHLGGSTGSGVNSQGLNLISQQHDTEAATSGSIEQVASYLSTVFGSRGVRLVTVAECMGNNPPAYRLNPRPHMDPNCDLGIIKDNVCCAASCGRCGGTGCSLLPGGSSQCCMNNIISAGYSCQVTGAPCILD